METTAILQVRLKKIMLVAVNEDGQRSSREEIRVSRGFCPGHRIKHV